MDIKLTADRLAEERAFVQRYTDSIAARPVNYAADYTAPADTRPRKVGIVGVRLTPPLSVLVKAVLDARPSGIQVGGSAAAGTRN